MSAATPSDRDLADRVADLATRRPRAILLVTLLLAALAGWRASRLELRPDFAELLPADDPAVVVLREMDRRMPSLSTVIVGVASPSPEANRRFVDDLVPRLQALALPEIAAVEWGVKDEEAFFRRHRLLFAHRDQLEDAHDRIRRAILKRKNPMFVDLAGDDEPLEARRRQIDERARALFDKFPDGYFATKDRELYAVVVRVNGSLFGAGPGARVALAVRRAAAELQPAGYHPSLEVELTGNVVAAGAERDALENDLVLATSLSVLLVCLVIFLFYGRLRAVPLAVTPALLGGLLSLAFAQLAFGYLNSSTAFLGSIIVGNGINYAIIQMARYEEERRRGRAVRDAIAVALRTTWRATILASLGAAVAYGSLVVTSFRGFNQFGYIGGMGMILSWGATVLVLPALWALLDRGAAAGAAPRVRGFAAAGPLGRLAERHPWPLVGGALVLTALALVPLPRYVRDPFEYDFRKLRNQVSQHSAAERLSARLNPIFGRSLSPGFVLADDPSQVEEIRRRLRAQDQPHRVLGSTKTVNDFLPGTFAEQREKLAILGRIRKLIDANLALLDDRERAEVTALRPPDDLRVLTAADLPASVRRNFTEADGTVGRPIAYYPREDITVWDGRTQMKLAQVVASVRLADGRTIRSSGSAVVFAGMLQAIVRDGPVVTAVAFLGVMLLVLVLTRRRGGTALILGALAVGVLWMVGAAAAAQVRVNFLNFIALPITFGIGIDYAINLHGRYQLEGGGRVAHVVEATGGAVALCSLTTIIGYGALLVADNQALRSFGALAILGEVATLTAALLVLPAVLVLLERRRAARAAPAGAASAPAAEVPSGEP